MKFLEKEFHELSSASNIWRFGSNRRGMVDVFEDKTTVRSWNEGKVDVLKVKPKDEW